MSETKGFIYILTNRSFPDYVKIGYADNVENRLVELNRSECIPFAFRVYATYEVPKRLTDLNLHNLIDQLNPSLRAIDTFNGKPRKKEFYAMSKEDAFSLLKAIAEIHDRTDKLKLYPSSAEERAEEDIADLVEIESETRTKVPLNSIEDYCFNKNPKIVAMYKKLQDEVFASISGTSIGLTSAYISWIAGGRQFAEIYIQRNRIMLLTLEPTSIHSIGNKVPESFGWGRLCYRTYINSEEDFEEAKNIIIESYKQRI